MAQIISSKESLSSFKLKKSKFKVCKFRIWWLSQTRIVGQRNERTSKSKLTPWFGTLRERSKRLAVDDQENICNPHSQSRPHSVTARALSQSERTHVLANARTHQCPLALQSIYLDVAASFSVNSKSLVHTCGSTAGACIAHNSLSSPLERLFSPGLVLERIRQLIGVQWFAARYAETCSKSSFWQQIKLWAANEKEETPKVIFGRRPFFSATQKLKKIVGGKSLFAGNAGFSISGSKSLTHPLANHPYWKVPNGFGEVVYKWIEVADPALYIHTCPDIHTWCVLHFVNILRTFCASRLIIKSNQNCKTKVPAQNTTLKGWR